MENRFSAFRNNSYKALLIIIVLQFLSSTSIEAQFDSLFWMNRFSNYSVTSRDNIQKALFINKRNLYVSATTERDYTNFDISTLYLDNNLELKWKESYSSSGNRLSYDRIIDAAVDSSGSIFIIGKSEMEYPDPFLIKHNSEGDLLWIFDFKESVDTYLEFGLCYIETDEFGNCYLTANINSQGPNIFFKTMVFKFDQEGNIIWYKGLDLPYAQKMIIDDDQNILIAYRNDEAYKQKIVLQKYNSDGVLIFDKRSEELRLDVFDIKCDKNKNIYIFSNKRYYNSQNFLSTHVLISKFDSMGNMVNNTIVDNTSDIKKVAKFVQPVTDSTFLLGIDSYSTSNGIDNQLILVDAKLQIVSSFTYDSEWHNNDYLISFDQTDDDDVIVTGITFINANDFFPFIYKVRDYADIDWMTIPSISDTTMAYPKNVFVDQSGSVILLGDAEMSIVPQFGTTHSNFFISKFSPSGEELQIREFGAEGKSDISASKLKTDSIGNTYVSGIIQNGPILLYPEWNYNQDIFLCKYGADGTIKWKNVIDLPQGRVDYIDHFITGDSLITVVCYILNNTKLFSIDKYGIIRDSAEFDAIVKAALPDSQGNLFLFLWSESEFHIIKINCDLSVERDLLLSNSKLAFDKAFLEDDKIYFVTGYPGDQQLYKYSTDLDKIWQIYLSAHTEGFISLKTDHSGNIFVIGTGKVLKLKSNGTLEWIKQVNYSNFKVNLLSTGNLVLTGSTCGTLNCTPVYLMLMSGTGEIIKSVIVPFPVRHFIVDNNDLIYLFDLENNYRKYSSQLNLLTDDSFIEKSNGYNYFFNDVKIDNGNIIIAGSTGAVWYPYNGLHSWKTLAVAKIGKVKSAPYFFDESIEVQVHPGDSLALTIPANDYDNDPIIFNLISPWNKIALDEKTGILTINTLPGDTLGHFDIKLSVIDTDGGSDTATISVTLGNKAPLFSSQPNLTVFVDSTYSYTLSAKDADNDDIFYEISKGPLWLNLGSTGLLYGYPTSNDVGIHEIILRCFDIYGGEGIQKFNLTVCLSDVKADFIFYDDDFLLYPVPASKILNMSCNKFPLLRAQIKIVDLRGTIIKQLSNINSVNETTIQLNIDDISPGVYYLLIYDMNLLYSKKFVIQ